VAIKYRLGSVVMKILCVLIVPKAPFQNRWPNTNWLALSFGLGCDMSYSLISCEATRPMKQMMMSSESGGGFI
jgi:hypothetical protein